jgi:hypothetical protein
MGISASVARWIACPAERLSDACAFLSPPALPVVISM